MLVNLILSMFAHPFNARLANFPCLGKERIAWSAKTLCLACFCLADLAATSTVDIASVHFRGAMHRQWLLGYQFDVELVGVNHQFGAVIANEELGLASVKHLRQNMEKTWREAEKQARG